MAKSKDRPGGMDQTSRSSMNWPKPTEKSRPPASEMGAVARVAAGPVEVKK